MNPEENIFRKDIESKENTEIAVQCVKVYFGKGLREPDKRAVSSHKSYQVYRDQIYEKGNREGWGRPHLILKVKVEDGINEIWIEKHFEKKFGWNILPDVMIDRIIETMPTDVKVVPKISAKENKYYDITEASINEWFTKVQEKK